MLRKLTILLLLMFPINGIAVGQNVIFRMVGQFDLQPPTERIPGPDINGYDQATFQFEAVFPPGLEAFTFPQFGGLQVFQAESATLTITGAAEGSNGTFTATDPVLYRPGGGDFGRSQHGFFASATFNGTDVVLRASTNEEEVGGLLEPVVPLPSNVIGGDQFGRPSPATVVFSDFTNNLAQESLSNYGVVNVLVSLINGMPPIPGDVNMDNVVDFLDIAPFITVLSSGEFQVEADVDQNGSVDFLDIAPFISILSSGDF